MNITLKIGASLLIVGLLPLLILALLRFPDIENQVREDVKYRLIASLEAGTGSLIEYVKIIALEAKSLSTDTAILEKTGKIIDGEEKDSQVSQLNKLLRQKVPAIVPTTITNASSSGLLAILVADTGGNIIASSLETELGRNFRNEPFFINGTRTVSTSLDTGNAFPDFASDILLVSAPMLDGNKRLLGVLINVQSMSYLQDTMQGKSTRALLKAATDTPQVFDNFTANSLIEIYLIDGQGKMTIPPIQLTEKREKQPKKREVNTVPVQKCLVEGTSFSGEYESYDGEKVIGVSLCGRTKSVFVSEISSSIVLAPVRKQQSDYIIVASIAGLVTIFFSYLFSRRLTRPIRGLTETIKEISTGKLDVEIEPRLIKTDDEVGDLAKAFNRIIVSLKLAMQNTGGSTDKNKKAD